MSGDCASYIKEKKRLQALAGSQNRASGSDQLICFLHGPGGSGKTTVIDLVVKYAAEYCGYLENFEFTPRTILVTAMTGVAATILLGETTHAAVYLNQKRPLEAEQIEVWKETRLLIIDEISFASKEDFCQLHKKIRRLKQQLHLRYGGLNIVFSGDFRQLEPVGPSKQPVYKEHCPEFREWVNCFIELRGMHRFKQDPEWGSLLLRFRDGTVTIGDIAKVNQRVVSAGTQLPNDIRYATYFNHDRDSINSALFEERCKALYARNGSLPDTVLIFSDKVEVQNSSKTFVPFHNSSSFWENCSKDDVKLPHGTGRMDPLLKLYNRCRVMLPCNSNVRDGKANGTQATVQKVILKNGETAQHVMLGGNIPVPAVLAHQVSHVLLKHSNSRILPSAFVLQPKQHNFKANILKPRGMQVKGHEREKIKMRATQVPLIVNNATTGHKLQGAGVDTLFVHNWSYVTNWPYVILSRVKTRVGLFLRRPLSNDLQKYSVPDALKTMMAEFSTKAPAYWTDNEYDELFNNTLRH